MNKPTAMAKILKFTNENLVEPIKTWTKDLVDGDLRTVEEKVYQVSICLFEHIMTHLLTEAAEQYVMVQKSKISNLAERPQGIRLRTGQEVKVNGLYRKRVSMGEDTPRQLLAAHWGLIGTASPGLYDLTTHASVLAPSYDLAQCLLARHEVCSSVSSLRKITNRVADVCQSYGEASLLLEEGESLAGKRVAISTDGGRSRTREANGKQNSNGRDTFDTPWREPKLFVIEVIDEEGRLSQHHLPIYGCRFSDEDHLQLLKEYLVLLEIDKAKEVQLVADGAPWIWNRVPEMLLELGVDKSRLTETLDHYHALQHLHKLFDGLPAKIGKRKRRKYWKRCCNWLWEGKSAWIIRLFQRLFKRIPARVTTELNYFRKHLERTKYADFQHRRLFCGSGLIESAVRRVINLRFKNTSTFWLPEIIEKLYFLRGAALSKRWNLVVANLANRHL